MLKTLFVATSALFGSISAYEEKSAQAKDEIVWNSIMSAAGKTSEFSTMKTALILF